MGEYYLKHQGILGMRWGVRRFQNPDGTLTEAGKKRYGAISKDGYQETKTPKGAVVSKDGFQETKKPRGAVSITSDDDKKAKNIKKAVTLAVVGGTALYTTNPKVREKVNNFLEKSKDVAIDKLKKAGDRAVDRAFDAAMVSIGTIAVTKLAKKLKTNESDSEGVKNRNKLILDTVTGGIDGFSDSFRNGNNNKNNNKNKNSNNINVEKEVTDRLGPPSKKSPANQDPEWSHLIGHRDDTVKAYARTLNKQGYDIDQIKQYLDDVDAGIIKHFDDYSNIYIGTGFVIRKI